MRSSQSTRITKGRLVQESGPGRKNAKRSSDETPTGEMLLCARRFASGGNDRHLPADRVFVDRVDVFPGFRWDDSDIYAGIFCGVGFTPAQAPAQQAVHGDLSD